MDNQSGSVQKRFLATLLALVVCCITTCIFLNPNNSSFHIRQIIPQIARQTHISTDCQGNHSGPWYSWCDKFKYLIENPIYKKYNIKTPKVKERRDLVYIVSSAPKRYERRKAIRDTWWPDCKPSTRVSVYRFRFRQLDI